MYSSLKLNLKAGTCWYLRMQEALVRRRLGSDCTWF